MTETKIPDPLAMAREMVNQWEKLANDFGGNILGKSEFVQGMQGATAFSLQIQQAVHEGMTKVLVASNLPSREDIAALGERVKNMESQLARIETAVGSPSSAQSTPKPKRTKRPPTSQK